MAVPVLSPKQAKKAPNLELRVGQYVALRDKIREMEDAHKEAMAPAKATLEKLAGVLLAALNTINAESVKTDEGSTRPPRNLYPLPIWKSSGNGCNATTHTICSTRRQTSRLWRSIWNRTRSCPPA